MKEINLDGLIRTITNPASNLAKPEVKVIRCASKNVSSFKVLIASSKLPTFQNTLSVGNLLRHGEIFLAYKNNRLAGCTCILHNVKKTFLGRSGIMSFPKSNVYFCGTYVDPICRNSGIGNALYSRRLSYSLKSYCYPIYVEMLGDGSPNSVHRATMPGYNFHICHNFEEIGYSMDIDQGKILVRLK